MTTTVANQQPRINLAYGRSMQSAQVVTLKSGQQNAASVDSKSPMHSFELRTSSTLPRCSRVTSNPEVEAQKRDGQNHSDLKSAFAIWDELKGEMSESELQRMEQQAKRFLDGLRKDLFG